MFGLGNTSNIISRKRLELNLTIPYLAKKLDLTSGLCEVQNLRQPTNFEFGRGTNFAWQNSEAVVPNRISPVMLFDHTECGQTSSEEFLRTPS